MSEVKTLKCDECGKLRVHDTNHWLEGTMFSEGFVAVGHVGAMPSERKFRVHLCGQECAMKWVAIKIGEL